MLSVVHKNLQGKRTLVISLERLEIAFIQKSAIVCR